MTANLRRDFECHRFCFRCNLQVIGKIIVIPLWNLELWSVFNSSKEHIFIHVWLSEQMMFLPAANLVF